MIGNPEVFRVVAPSLSRWSRTRRVLAYSMARSWSPRASLICRPTSALASEAIGDGPEYRYGGAATLSSRFSAVGQPMKASQHGTAGSSPHLRGSPTLSGRSQHTEGAGRGQCLASCPDPSWSGCPPRHDLGGSSHPRPAGPLDLPRFPGRFLFAWVAVAAGHAQPCLILHRAQVTKRGVPPGPVVHRLDPPEHWTCPGFPDASYLLGSLLLPVMLSLASYSIGLR